MLITPPGVCLPAAVTGPTAWAAFRLIFSCPSWSVVLASDETNEVDLISGPEFQGWLDEVTSRWYDARARAFVSTRILEVCGTLTPDRVRHLRIIGDRDEVTTSDRLRSYVKDQVRETLHRRFSIQAWELDVRARTDLLPETTRLELHRFLGLDQLVDARLCRKGVNYLFKTIKPEVIGAGSQIRFAETRRMADVRRDGPLGDPAHLARALALRAGEALLLAMAADCADGVIPSISAVDEKFRSLTEEHGAWAMVGLVLEQDRTEGGFVLPAFDDPALSELVERQEMLLSQVVNISDQSAMSGRGSGCGMEDLIAPTGYDR